MALWLKNRQFLGATAIMVGTMVGVGIFGIPFSFAKAGFLIGLISLVAIGAITWLLNLIYGEIVLRTHQRHQIVGYTKKYLGEGWKRVIFFSIILNTYAALLAYVSISGDFLSNVLSSFFFISSSSLSMWFFAIASLLILFGIRTVAWVELGLSLMFIAVIFLIFGTGFDKINFSNYAFTNYEFWFFPYGIMLFAFSGLAAIPLQRQILAENEIGLRKSITLAVLVAGVLYLIFGFTVLGISGEATSPDAISGLIDSLGGRIIFLGSLFGALAISTSYLMLGIFLLEVFHQDYGLNRKISWFLVVTPPFVLFMGGLRNFIDVISLGGAVGIGLEAMVLVFVFMKAKKEGDRIPEYSLSIPAWALYLLALVFAGGLVYTLIT